MTRLSTENTRERTSFMAGLACVVIMAIAASGCRTTPPSPLVDPETGDVLESAPPRQAVVAVHLIGIREEVPADSDAPFPAPGFAFAEGRIVAQGRARTIAGTLLTVAETRAWMDALRRAGTGVLLLSPVMAVEPGKTSSVSNMTQETVTANVLFDRTGAGVPQTESAWTGARVEAFSATCPFENALLVSLDVSVTSTKTEDFKVADGFRNDEGGKVLPLTIQLPERAVRRWRASALLPHRRSAIMAHWVRQYRIVSVLGGARRMREHIVCLATAGEKAPDPDAPEKEPYTAERFHYPIVLSWYHGAGMSAGSGSSDDAGRDLDMAAAREMSAEDVARAILPFRGNDESEAVSVGLAVVPGQTAGADVTERRTYVTGVSRPVEGDLDERRAFTLSEASEGVECSLELEAEEPLVRLRVRGFLGGACALRASPETRRSFRAPAGRGIEETYRFQVKDQECAEISAEIRSRTDRTFRIAPQWAAESSPPARGIEPSDHLALLGLGEPICPESPDP